MYEIKLCKRDRLGNAIPGKFLEYRTDDAAALAAWYERNAWRKPFKKKRKKKKNSKKAIKSRRKKKTTKNS